MKMTYRHVYFAVLFLALGGGLEAKDWRSHLLGTWLHDLNEDGIHSKGEITFHGNGSGTGWTKIWRSEADGGKTLVIDVTDAFEWKIEGDILVCFNMRTAPDNIFAPDFVTRDILLLADDVVLTYKTEDGKVRTLKRKPNQALQTTSMAGRAFGKVSVCDRHRLGV